MTTQSTPWIKRHRPIPGPYGPYNPKRCMDCGEKAKSFLNVDEIEFWFNTKCENKVAPVQGQWDECMCHLEHWRELEKNSVYQPKFQQRGCQHCWGLRTDMGVTELMKVHDAVASVGRLVKAFTGKDRIVIIGPSPEESEAGAPLESVDTDEYSTGAKRSRLEDRVKFDQLSPTAIREVAEAQALGDKIYGKGNWRKGIPVSSMLNHIEMHINAFKEELLTWVPEDDRWQTGENHLSHAAWGLMVLMEYRHRGMLDGLNDLGAIEEKDHES